MYEDVIFFTEKKKKSFSKQSPEWINLKMPALDFGVDEEKNYELLYKLIQTQLDYILSSALLKHSVVDDWG